MKWKMVFANIRNEETDYQEYGYRLLALPMAELRSVMMGGGNRSVHTDDLHSRANLFGRNFIPNFGLNKNGSGRSHERYSSNNYMYILHKYDDV